jgi:hypothetical protein
MTSRERVLAALGHRQPDRVPLDLGGMSCTGMAASSVHKLKVALGLCKSSEPVKVIECFLMLGEIDAPLREVLGVDVVGLRKRGNFGFVNTDWKEWRLFDGTPVLVPGKFNTAPDAAGNILQYPEGDRSLTPCARMPKGGFYFDSIIRQPPIDDDHLRVEDNLEEFGVLSAGELEWYGEETRQLRQGSQSAVMMIGPGTALGDINAVPAPQLRQPKGIRDVEEWYVSLMMRREYIREVFRRQTEISLKNLELLWQAVGENIDVIVLTATDFGMQTGPMMSPRDYADLFQPFHRKLNDWVHANTTWKTFQHSCGGIVPLLDQFIEAGFDISNPVQTSATGMEPQGLKTRFGGRTTFWGGGVDTQRVLPFGTPAEVREQVRERMRIFAPGGGFIFNPVHNVQAGVPLENLLALYEAVRKYRAGE